ncbi:MAG TPA: acyltransferase [Candidatus Sulfotelmatobacter sp.]|nr:acyltransferase [Candidatus Sulfotelmatobacter sp.]
MGLARGGRIATIDGLRGIAILLVVWFHYWQISWQSLVLPVVHDAPQWLAETGYLGVALFFFISGFVIALPFVEAHAVGAPPPTWRHFYTRRLLKIVPSYVLVIAVLIAIGFQTYPNLPAGAKDVGIHLLFVHDWFPAYNSSIDGVMWSLGVEVQFYLLFPLFCFAFLRWPRATVLVMFAIANAWRLWSYHGDHYYLEQKLAQLPGYLDFFAAGMFGAFAYVSTALRPQAAARRWLFTLMALAGVVLYVALSRDCYLHRFDPEWPQLWVVRWRSAIAVACFLTAVGSLFAFRRAQYALANPLLLYLAAISYNLYLWHVPIARELQTWRIPPYAGDPHTDHRWMLTFPLIAIPVALAVSTAVTYGFERPILRWRPRRRRLPATEGPEARTAITVGS